MLHARSSRRRLAAAALAVLLPATTFAQGQPSPPGVTSASPEAPPTEAQLNEARAHFDRGVTLFDGGDNDGALVEFQRAYELSRRPTVLFNVAATHRALRRYGEAIDALRLFLASNLDEAQRRQRRDAERTLRELEQLIARLTITIDPSDATLQVDGRVQQQGSTLVVGPGTHRIQATRDGRRTHLQEFTIASGETRELRITLLPMDGATPSGRVDPTAPSRASLTLVNAPPDATVAVDGQLSSSAAPLSLAAGAHHVAVQARGHRGWSGTVLLRPNAAHQLRVSLLRDEGRFTPLPFVLVSAGAGVCLLSTLVTGLLALETHAEFRGLSAGDPRLGDLEAQGRALGIAADVLGFASVGLAATAVYLFLKTDFRSSSAQLVAAPSSLGAVWRF